MKKSTRSFSVLIKQTMFFSLSLLLLAASFLPVNAAGEVDPTFNPGLVNEKTLYPYTNVERIVAQPDGKVLISGFFSAVGKINSYGIARLNADGTVDTTFHAPIIGFIFSNYAVSAIGVQQDGKIVIGGNFTSVAGQPRTGIARLNTDGSFDASFNVSLGNGTGGNRNISDIKITADNKIIAVGNFTYNSGANKYIIRLNSDGTIDSYFNSPSVVNALLNGYIAEVLPDGKILFAGLSNSQGSIYRLNADGSIDSSFMPITLSGSNISYTPGIFTIKPLADGRFYIGGGFNTFNGFPIMTANLIRINADGSLDTSFNAGNTGPNFAVRRIEILSNNQLFIGGEFETFNGVARRNIVKINSDGSLDNSVNFSGRTDTKDFAVIAGGKILLGGQAGDYSGVGNNVHSALLKLNADGSVDVAQTVVGDTGKANKILVQPDGKILIGGIFTHTDNQRRYSLSRINVDGTLDTTFTSPDYNYEVLGLDIRADGKILVSNSSSVYRLNSNGSLDRTIYPGGAFDAKFLSGGGAIVSSNFHLRKTFEAGGFDSSFDVTANNNIRKILLQPDGKFMVAGDFTMIAGVTRGRIARINANGTLDTTFAPPGGASNSIFDAALQSDGKVIIGGNFPGINFNTNYKYLARLSSDGSLDTSFNPIVEGGVQSLKIQSNGKVLVGGSMYSVNGLASRIVRLNQDGSLDATFNPGTGPDDAVLSIDSETNGNIIIGGSFTRVINLDRLGVARLASTTTAKTLFDFDGDGRTDVSIFRPSSGVWYIQQSSAGFAGLAFGQTGDKLVPADYDGDGKTDVAVFRNGTWYLQRSQLGFNGISFGDANDIPVPADYDGDGKTDVAVFRPSNGVWYLLQSRDGFAATVFGLGTDKPVSGDYNGDGKADIAVFRPSTGIWYTSTNPAIGYGAVEFGTAEDKLVPADYDGDGKTDVAVFRPSNGTWYLNRSRDGFAGIAFGLGTDLPVAADYDGDGKADVAVFRNGTWYLNRTTQGFSAVAFGVSDDKPVPNAFVR